MASDLRADVGQLLWVGFQGVQLHEPLRRRIAAGEVGAAIVFRRNLVLGRATVGLTGAAPDAGGAAPLREQAMAGSLQPGVISAVAVQREVVDLDALIDLNRALHAAAPADAPLLVCVDQEGGRVQRVRAPATVWPPMLAHEGLGGGADAAMAAEVGLAMGRELAALGFDVDFAPVLDVHTNPVNPIIGDRAFATTPERVAETALAFAAGLARAGVIACGKHFPGHGDTTTDSHLELPRLDHDLARLEAVELLPFRRAAAAGLPMIMTAHVVFAALDPDRPATLSAKVIDQLLRGRMGYRGLIVSDDLDMKAIAAGHGAGEAAVAAIRAGCDVLLLCCDDANQHAARTALIESGESDSALRSRIGLAAARVRALKASHAGRPAAAGREVIGCAAHRELADRLAGLS